MKKILSILDSFFVGRPPAILPILLILSVVLLGLVDHFTGQEFSFSIFYIAPVFLAAWYGSRGMGLLFSLLSALVWLAADFTSGGHYSHNLIPIWNCSVRLLFFVTISLLISTVRQQLLMEESLADTDPLTGLSNRRHFQETLELESLKLQRYKHPLTLAYIDLDNFKHVNDAMGHDTGDAVLQAVAATIHANIRNTDLAARLGGDEFTLLFPMSNYDEAASILNKLLMQLRRTMSDHEWPITFSIGMITCEESMGGTRDLLKRTDDLMYLVKKSGKNSVIHQKWSGEVDEH